MFIIASFVLAVIALLESHESNRKAIELAEIANQISTEAEKDGDKANIIGLTALCLTDRNVDPRCSSLLTGSVKAIASAGIRSNVLLMVLFVLMATLNNV